MARTEAAVTTAQRQEALLDQLRQLAPKLVEVEAERERLYNARVALFQQLRALDPPCPHPAIAAAAGMKAPVGVIAALRRAENPTSRRKT